MATKRQKKEKAKQRIRDVVPTFPIPRIAPPIFRALNLVSRGAEVGGQALVELDPLGIITDDPVIMPARDTSGSRLQSPEVVMAMVNDPMFKLTKEQVDLINDDSRMVASTGMGLVEVPSSAAATKPNQFDRSRILPQTRSRKKTKTDKDMSKALREANARLRTNKGKLRKGKTQADVMRLAHRIRRRMK
jgi:hypothetical protein